MFDMLLVPSCDPFPSRFRHPPHPARARIIIPSGHIEHHALHGAPRPRSLKGDPAGQSPRTDESVPSDSLGADPAQVGLGKTEVKIKEVVKEGVQLSDLKRQRSLNASRTSGPVPADYR